MLVIMHHKNIITMSILIKTVFAVFVIFLSIPLQAQKNTKPNVLFIAIDDINDWVGPLGGHPQAKTPNLDKFCKEGSVVFKNAVCAAPICGPSRSAVLSGFMPNNTGVYGNATNILNTPIGKTHAMLPEYFSKHGYYTLSDGKIFHKHATAHGVDFGHWAFDEHHRSRRYVKEGIKQETLYSAKGVIAGKKNPDFKAASGAKLSWASTKCDIDGTVDYKVVNWAKDKLAQSYEKPFFMAVGLIKPHLPWIVPQEFFDMYDLETIQTPALNESDLDDIINPNGKLTHKPDADYQWVKKHGLEKEATRAYLASISYADACLGVLFDALENSPYADNTIVVIWGDHGWHLGEKLRYKKNTLWSEATKTPFVIRTPDMHKMEYSDRTVSLIDIYPTLVDYCGLPDKQLDGVSITKLLSKPNSKWQRPGITVSASGTSVMGERWHYISNLSGSEELYDLDNDALEWNNLASNPEYKDIVKSMRVWVPKHTEVAERINYKKPPKYVDADADPRIKEGRDLHKLK